MSRSQVQLFMLEIAKKAGLRLGWNARSNTFLATQSTTEREEHLVGLLLTCPEKERYFVYCIYILYPAKE